MVRKWLIIYDPANEKGMMYRNGIAGGKSNVSALFI